MFSGKERTTLKKMGDKEFKEGGKAAALSWSKDVQTTEWKMEK